MLRGHCFEQIWVLEAPDHPLIRGEPNQDGAVRITPTDVGHMQRPSATSAGLSAGMNLVSIGVNLKTSKESTLGI